MFEIHFRHCISKEVLYPKSIDVNHMSKEVLDDLDM
jgi:hypothetical protein